MIGPFLMFFKPFWYEFVRTQKIGIRVVFPKQCKIFCWSYYSLTTDVGPASERVSNLQEVFDKYERILEDHELTVRESKTKKMFLPLKDSIVIIESSWHDLNKGKGVETEYQRWRQKTRSYQKSTHSTDVVHKRSHRRFILKMKSILQGKLFR